MVHFAGKISPDDAIKQIVRGIYIKRVTIGKSVGIFRNEQRHRSWKGINRETCFSETSDFRELSVGKVNPCLQAYSKTLSTDEYNTTVELGRRQTSRFDCPRGKDKAVYLYPLNIISYWRSELPEVDFPFGSFGKIYD